MSKGINVRLREEREKRGWSQARVAEQIDTDAINVSRWERGFATPSPYFREKLCRLYNRSAQELGFLDTEREVTGPTVIPSSEPGPLTQTNAQSTPQVEELARSSKVLACLGYGFLWVSGIFIYLLTNENRFVRFHSLQSALFFAGSNLLSAILLLLMSWTMNLAGDVDKALLTVVFAGLVLVFSLLNLFTFIIWVVAIYQAGRGKYYSFPFVASLRDAILAKRQRSLASEMQE